MAYRTMWKNETPAAGGLVIDITGVTANDVLVAAVIADTSNTTVTWSSLPTGFVNVGGIHCSADGQAMLVAIKATASGSETTLTFSPSNGGSSFIGAVWAFSGRDNAAAQDFTADVVNNNSAQASAWSITSGSVTPGNNGCDVLAIMGSDATSSVGSAVAHSFATATGTTGGWTNPGDVSNNGFLQMALGYATQTTAGAITATGTGTASGKSAGRSMITMGLKAAAGGATGNPYYYYAQLG